MKLFHRFVHPDFDTQITRHIRHPFADGGTAACRMEDPEFILEKRKNREQAGTLKGRHPEILGLKRKRRDQPRIGEVSGEI